MNYQSQKQYQRKHDRQKRVLQNTHPGKLVSGLLAKIHALKTRLKHANQIRMEKHSLANLSDHQLRDIGLSRFQVQPESIQNLLDKPKGKIRICGLESLGVTFVFVDRAQNATVRKLPKD